MRLTQSLILLFFTTRAFSQIKFDPPSLEFIGTGEEDDIRYPIQIINNTGAEVEVHWTFEPDENFPEDWETQIHDLNTGYFYGTYMSSCSLPSMVPDSDVISSRFLISTRRKDSGPMSQYGFGILRFYNDCERTNEIGATVIPTVATDNLNISDINLFPNPTTSSFQLQNDDDVSRITIFNLMGQQVYRLNHVTEINHDISSLSAGLYMVRMEDKNREIIKTIRLHKQ